MWSQIRSLRSRGCVCARVCVCVREKEAWEDPGSLFPCLVFTDKGMIPKDTFSPPMTTPLTASWATLTHDSPCPTQGSLWPSLELGPWASLLTHYCLGDFACLLFPPLLSSCKARQRWLVLCLSPVSSTEPGSAGPLSEQEYFLGIISSLKLLVLGRYEWRQQHLKITNSTSGPGVWGSIILPFLSFSFLLFLFL